MSLKPPRLPVRTLEDSSRNWEYIKNLEIATVADLNAEIAAREAADNAEVTNRNDAIETHRVDTTNVHGIPDTSLLDTIALRDAAIAIAVPAGRIDAYGGRSAPSGYLMCDGAAVSRTTYATLFGVLVPSLGTFTVTIASPGVFTLNGHGLVVGDQIFLTTTGALPTGLSANTLYYVTNPTANTFNLSTSRANADAGTKINTSGSQSGTHTLWFCPYGLGNGSTTFNIPNLKGNVPVGMDTSTEFGNLGETGGTKTHTLTTTEMPSHSHGPGSGAGSTVFLGNYISGANSANWVGGSASFGYFSTTGNTGGGAAHNNTQPYVVTNYIIKT